MKNKFRRFISAAAIVCLIAGMFVMPAAAQDEDKFEAQKKLLSDLGILKIEITDPEAALSRGQFADMAMRTYYKELPSYQKASTFNDVIPNYEYKDAVEAGYASNIIRGVEDNVFGVDMTLTPGSAITIMLRILNYEKWIEAAGDYNLHYLDTAREIGLISGIDLKKEELSFKEAVKLIYNAIEIAPLKLSSAKPGEAEYIKDKNTTLIYERLGIDQRKGIVTDNFYVSLSGGEGVGIGNVRVDGIDYKAGKSGAENFIGYSVRIYFDEDTNTILHIRDNNSELTVIDHTSDCAWNNGSIHYYNANGGGRDVYVGADAIVIYNGKLVRSGQFDPSLFDLDLGTITIIKKSFENHTVVVIQSYKDTVSDRLVENDDGFVFVDKFNAERNIYIDDEDNFYISDENGAPMELGGVAKESVISAAISLDGQIGSLIVNTGTSKISQAYVISAAEDSALLKTYNESIHTYEEKTYEYTKYFKEINKEENNVKPGRECTVYLDVFGKAAYISADTDMSDFYAYIIKASYDDVNTDEPVTLKLFRDDGKVADYKMAKAVQIDGISCKKKNADEIVNLLGINNGDKSGLAYISLTFDSEIKEIDTCPEENSAREADYSLYKTDREAKDTMYKIEAGASAWTPTFTDRNRYSSDTKSFDAGILMDSSTKIMAVPRECKDADRFKLITSASFINDREYKVKAYGRSDDKVTADVVIYEYWSRYDPLKENAEVVGANYFARVPFQRSYDCTTAIVTDVSEKLNTDTNEIEKCVTMTTIPGGTEVSYFAENELLEGICRGQITRFMTVGGALCYIENVYDIPTREFNKEARIMRWQSNPLVYSYYLEDNDTYLVDSGGAYSTGTADNPTYSIARAKVMNCSKTHLAFITRGKYDEMGDSVPQNDWKIYECSTAKVFTYNERSGEVLKKTLEDIISVDESTLKNSEIVVITKNRRALGIILY
ncbi:MAG: S-layer homology domain-containing protein [Clostridiales bacterium]|nr:S-layer homology domain-containing protein [Clostridiales bacterium]